MTATPVAARWSTIGILLLLHLTFHRSDGTRHLQIAGQCSHRKCYHLRIQRRHDDDDDGYCDDDNTKDEQESPFSLFWRWNPATLLPSVDAFELSQLSVAVVSSHPSIDRRRKSTQTKYHRFGGRNDDEIGHHCRYQPFSFSLKHSSLSSPDETNLESTAKRHTPSKESQHKQSPTNMARLTSKNRKICMVLPQTHCDQDSSSFLTESSWTDEAKEIAERLDIPCLTLDELAETFVPDSDEHDKDSCEGFESSLSLSSRTEPTRYTHILRLVPYNYQGDLDNDHELYSVNVSSERTTYALAIESMGNHDSNNESKQRRKKKKQSLSNGKLKLSSNPFYIDLDPSSNIKARRRTSTGGGGQKDLLVQAVKPPSSSASSSSGGSSSSTFTIHDWTAGLGQDSMVLASSMMETSGLCTSPTIIVWMFERDPIVGALLKDALRRLDVFSDEVSNAVTGTGSLDRIPLSKRLRLVLGDGKTLARAQGSPVYDEGLGRVDDEDSEIPSSTPLSSSSSSSSSTPFDPKPDVVYLDPMFPPRQKSAAVKKGMALLQELLETQNVKGGDEDENTDDGSARINEEIELLLAALECAQVRVVVKRPIKAPPLGFQPSQKKSDESNDNHSVVDGCERNKRIIPKPSYDLKGSINRFDIYVI